MPQWTNKERRQYEHIKGSSKSRGASTAKAKEIAARTVNKSRRQRAETPNKTTQGTGNPNLAMSQRSKQELYNRAKAMNIAGRSKMTKSDLLVAIARKRG